MKKIFSIILILLCTWCFSDSIKVLREITNPDQIVIDSDKVYIVERAKVFIYSLKELKLLKTFGEAGEGPGEFKINPNVMDQQVNLIVQPDHLFLHNRERILYFSKNGRYIKQKKLNRIYLYIYPLGNRFVAWKFKGNFFSFGIQDSSFNEIVEMNREPVNNPRGPRKASENKIKILKSPRFRFLVHQNKIYLLSKNEFIIEVFNQNGDSLKPVVTEYNRIKIDSLTRQKIINYFKNRPTWKRNWESNKKRLWISKLYPAIRTFFIDNGNIYVETYKRINQRTELITFNLKGQQTSRKTIPIMNRDFMSTYVHCIRDSKLFQLIPNEDDEWELHITGI